MNATLGAWAVLLAVAPVPSACATEFREPKTTAHANSDYVSVPYLPPAALVEVAGEPPERGCVWFDGHWVWRGDEYTWLRGGWVKEHPDLYYAPWDTLIMEDGRIMFAEGAWFKSSGHRVAAPPILKPARTPPNEVTSEFDSSR